MKKLTILALHLGYGGIENSIASLVNNLSNEYDVNIVSVYKLYDKPIYDINDKVKIKYLIDNDLALRMDVYKKLIKGYALKTLLKRLISDYVKGFHFIKLIKDMFMSIVITINKKRLMTKYLKEDNSDIIISTRDIFNFQVSKYIGSKCKKIAWEHNHHHGDMKYAKRIVNSCYNMDNLVLVSDSLRSFYKKQMKKNDSKCRCVYIPNTLDYIPEELSKLDNKNLISVGRMSREKGYDDLIEVFNIINNYDKNIHLDIIGDGAQKNLVADKIYQYKLNKSVNLHGFQKRDYINKLLLNSSLYLMTSHTESFGLVLIEAMSYGIPCIAFSSAEGANDIIIDGVNGYLIKNRDFKEMADKTMELLKDKDKRESFSIKARETSLRFSKDIVKKEWINLIRKG
ncbi:MAG: glycosyltransferase [Bacilli bacterium]|nr:glycosyltransferase [Bacilli bacterium]